MPIRDTLWRRVISKKFGVVPKGWCSGEVKGSYGTKLWRETSKERELVSTNAMLLVGDGRRISFWRTFGVVVKL